MATERRQLNSHPGFHMTRFIFAEACQGKAKHSTQRAARAAIRADKERFGEERMYGIGTYRCPFCAHFHLGHVVR